MTKEIHFVHCVDTEGPLHEPLTATFEGLKNNFGIELEATQENLLKLRDGIGVDEKLKEKVQFFVGEKRLNYNSSWKHIDQMLEDLLSPEWRNKFKDDEGTPYQFNWFIMDHAGFTTNPRRRALGYNVIFDYYKQKFTDYKTNDEIHWHYHPVPFFKEANKSSNNFSLTNEHFQVLSRKVIDHNWFPVCFRPGLHTERPDINLFLEQWIPFDYGNQALTKGATSDDDIQKDVSHGRMGDWRRAPTHWGAYHPDFYDYQKEGNMKRWIAKCLNLNSRLRNLSLFEIEAAFEQANRGEPTICAFTNHDFRPIQEDVEELYQQIQEIKKKYPEVKIKFSGAVEAMRTAYSLEEKNSPKISLELNDNKLDIKLDQETWGCQPYFCFKTTTGEYFHENLDHQSETHWSYVFDSNSIELRNIETIAVAASNDYGNYSVEKITI